MISIEGLLHSLAYVIVRYHDTFIKNDTPTEAQSRARAAAILKNKQLSQTRDELSEMITFCTKGYDKRAHYLCYILNEVLFVKEIIDRQKPLSPEEFKQCQTQIIQMFNNFSALLQIQESSSHTVRYSSLKKESIKDITLSGLLVNWTNVYSKSGYILDDLFTRRNVTPKAPKARFIEVTEKMCEEHQTLVRANYAEKQVKELTDKLAKAAIDVTAQTAQATKLKAELLQVKTDSAEQAKKLKDELAKEKAEAAAQIKDLSAKVEQAESRLKVLQATTGPKPAQIAPVFSPGMMFFPGSMAKWKANQAATKTAAPDAGSGAPLTTA